MPLSWSLMLSQAKETVTRAWRLFAVRIVAMAVSIAPMSLVLAAPFINVLAGDVFCGHGLGDHRGGSTLSDHWFRPQVYRGRIRRRQTASRLPTDSEALASVSWAAAATLAAIPAVSALLVIGAARLPAPSRR